MSKFAPNSFYLYHPVASKKEVRMAVLTPEEMFYGKAAYEAGMPTRFGTAWSSLLPKEQEAWVKRALAARTAVYVDPVEEMAKDLYLAEYPDDHSAEGFRMNGSLMEGYRRMAKFAIERGAK
jgi:hypothetical protein